VLDLFVFEPLAKIFGYWAWTHESIWFGSPVGNIIGGFLVIMLFIYSGELIIARIKGDMQQLAASFAAMTPNLIILIGVLKVWITLFGLI